MMSPPLSPSLAERLTALRRQRGWSQRKLAAAAGVNNATVSRIEAGKLTGAGITVLTLLATALQCELSVLLVGPQPGARSIASLDRQVCQALIHLSTPGKAARPYPQLPTDLDFLRRTRMACDFTQTLAMAPPVLRALSIHDQPDDTAHACFNVASALRMLGCRSTAWLAIRLAQQAADIARGTTALSPTITAVQAIFAIQDGELGTATTLLQHARPTTVDGPAAAAGHAAFTLMEGRLHASTRLSDGSDQIARAELLLQQSDTDADILGTGIFRPSDLDGWQMRNAMARHDYGQAFELAGTAPKEPFGALLWHLNMSTITLQLNEIELSVNALMTAREISPRLPPGRVDTIATAEALLTKRLNPHTLRVLRSIRAESYVDTRGEHQG